MPIEEDLRTEVKRIFREQWTVRDGRVVPSADDLSLRNDAIKLDAVVLYADLDSSTQLVDSYKHPFSAEIYKTFLHCAARIVRDEQGEITAYDGDRIMAVFIGDSMYDASVRAALKINYARVKVIAPAIMEQYPTSTYTEKHVVGIDASQLFVARTGVRGANDLVWVGRAANHAAKLCTLDSNYPTWITSAVYSHLTRQCLYGSSGQSMWEQRNWNPMNRIVHCSNWLWAC